jgi:protein O-GlcNAc transferase
MGVPVVTLSGEHHVSRVGKSLLTQVGLTELIAASEVDYVERAVQLAAELARLAELRRTLRDRMRNCSLMDGPAMARDIEAAYLQMCRDHMS